MNARMKFVALAAAVGLIALGGANRAEAGIRVTLTSGANVTQIYAAGTFLTSGTLNFDGYTVVLNTVLTNFPGSTLGTLTTTTNLATAAAPTVINDLTVLAEVVNDIV